MKSLPFQFALVVCLLGGVISTRASVGATVPWTTYEAEDMKTTGTVLGPKYDPYLVETESSGQKCVKLTAAGEYVEFTAHEDANAVVVRYSLPDAPAGGGIDSTIGLYVNGKLIKDLPITSRYSYLYGNYPFSNTPSDGKTRNFYNEARLKDVPIIKGDIVRLQKPADGAEFCIVDLVDLEKVAPPLAQPSKSLSIIDFGAGGRGDSDDTDALKKCIEAAAKSGQIVWVPAGDYKITADIMVPPGVTIQGAGMWHTTFTGDAALYGQSDRRVRFLGQGGNIHLADFAILGHLNYRNDREPNDGVGGTYGVNSTISRIWIEHTKTGMWLVNSSNLVVRGCRIRDTIADGINFCVGMRSSVIEDCATRGTGDDCFAIWPTTYTKQAYKPGRNIVRYCTGELPFLANGGAIYGGKANRMEHCLFTDISPGCGILISTTFPTSDEKAGIDNNFSGTTVIRHCEVARCGGYDHDWAWRSAVEICLDRRNISGLEISDLNIHDSMSDGFGIVGPGSKHGQGTLTDSRLVNVNIPDCGLGTNSCTGLWIRKDAHGGVAIVDSKIHGIQNDSTNFSVTTH